MIFHEKPAAFDPKFEIVGTFVLNDGHFILLHRQDHKPQGNTWGIPSGKQDPGESLLAAAVRETGEETGLALAPEQLAFFQTLYVRYPEYDFVYHIFQTELEKQAEIVINPGEHKEGRWITPTAARELPLIGNLNDCLDLFFGIQSI